MSLAIPYRDQSRTPLAFSLAVLLHGAVAAALLAMVLIHPAHKPLELRSFELVAGPPSDDATGPASSPGPLLSAPILRQIENPPTPQPPAPEDPAPQAPVEQVQPTQVTTPPPTPTVQPNVQKPPPPKPPKPVVARGSTPAPAPSKQPKVMSAAEWQKLQNANSPAPTPTRGTNRVPPKVGVSVGGIVDNLNKLNSRGGGSVRAIGTGSLANGGGNGSSDDYFARLIKRVQDSFVAPPATNGLSATIRLVIDGDGAIIAKRLIRSSGDERFDQAVNQALARLVHVDPPPNGEQFSKDFDLVPNRP